MLWLTTLALDSFANPLNVAFLGSLMLFVALRIKRIRAASEFLASIGLLGVVAHYVLPKYFAQVGPAGQQVVYPNIAVMTSIAFYGSVTLLIWAVTVHMTLRLAALAFGATIVISVIFSTLHFSYDWVANVVGGLLYGAALVLIGVNFLPRESARLKPTSEPKRS